MLGCYVPRAGLREGGRGWARGKRALVYWADWARVEFGVGFPGRCWAAGLKWVRLGFGLG